MKIGIDARLWSESGVGRYTQNLVKNLFKIDQKNNYYTLFIRKRDFETIKSQISNVKSSNFKVIIADIRWHSVKEQFDFPKILNRENLDLIHFPYFSVPIFYKKPFVITIHDLIINHFPTGKASTLPQPFYMAKRIGYNAIVKSAAKRAKKIITVSNATKNDIVKTLKIDPKKIYVTYEAVDDRIQNSSLNFSQDIEFKIKNLPDKFFLYVGNAYPHKNLENLTEAFLSLHDKDLKLILVGKEDYFYKRLKIKNQNNNSVVFYGKAEDNELSALYKSAQALIMPSLMEGFGLPVLEAMANKCLVLASDIPVLHEIGEDSLIYFNPRNVNDICEKIRMSIKEGNEELIEKAYKKSKEFSWKKMARETLRIYDSAF